MRLYLPEELGPDGYPAEWHLTIKHDVLEAAGHRCVRCLHPYRNGEHGRGEWSPCDGRCRHGGPARVDGRDPGPGFGDVLTDIAAGVDHGMVIEAQWRVLTVHHLDGNKANCRWWNLAALCQRDHLLIQGKVILDRPWPWEHSEWFRPYVAGYYALVYLGEELTREEATARLDELLSLERQATLGGAA